MEPMLDRIDESGIAAYLESSKERNVSFYARFGFDVVGEISAEDGALRVWRMRREPRVPDR
jgi:predicted GNAT family N-acyltransferase